MNTFASNQPTVYMLLPMEVISSPQQIPVLKVSDMYKKQEEVPSQYTYVKFPFGILDYDGLKKIQEYHEQKLTKRIEGEETEWLKGCESLCMNIGIDIAKIKRFFEAQVWSKSNEQVYVRNFVEKRWVSDSEMDRLLDVANKQYSDTVCFAHKPNKHLCAVTQIQKKLETIFSSGTNIKRILIALQSEVRMMVAHLYLMVQNKAITGHYWQSTLKTRVPI